MAAEVETGLILGDMSSSAGVERVTVWARLKALVVRLTEVALAGVGLAYVLFADGTAASEVRYLSWFDGIAIAYLLIGFFVVRRHRHGDAAPVPVFTAALAAKPWVGAARQRFSFALAVIASLTGFIAASDVLVHGTGAERDGTVRALGAIAVVCAFTLLHVGYAKFYRNLDLRAGDAPGLRFPDGCAPVLIDYLYFSITIGVSFAVSDVEVVRRSTRWYVLVHSLVSFFYNAGVLAIAVGVVTGR